MSALDFLDTTPEVCGESQRRTEAYLKGERPLPHVATGAASTSAFLSLLEENAKEKDAKAAEYDAVSNYEDRANALNAIAASRDLRYATARRPYLMAVGFNQKMRAKFNATMTAQIFFK